MIKSIARKRGEALKALSEVRGGAAANGIVSGVFAQAGTSELKELALDKIAVAESEAQAIQDEFQKVRRSASTLSSQGKFAKEIDFAEHAVESQLKKDHASAQLISAETTLLGKASASLNKAADLQKKMQSERANRKNEFSAARAAASVEHKSQSATAALRSFATGMATMVKADTAERKGLALDQKSAAESEAQAIKDEFQEGRRSVSTVSSQGRFAKEVDFAKDAVESELKKAGASSQFISEEKALLEKASAALHKGADLQTKLQSERAHDKQKLSTDRAASSVEHESHAGSAALRSFATGMATVVDDDTAKIKATESVRGRAMEALTEVKASAATKGKVSQLLAQAETLERKELALDKRSLAESEAQASKNGYKGALRSTATSSAQAQVAKDVDFVENAVEFQLKKDNAPGQLITEERNLLRKVSAIAHRGAEPRTKKQTERVYEHKGLATVSTGTIVSAESQSAARALRAHAEGMATVVKNDQAEIKETDNVQAEVMKDLSEAKANVGEKTQVSDVMAKLESLERHTLSLDEKSRADAAKEAFHQSARGNLRAVKRGMQTVAKEDQQSLHSFQDLEGKAKSALEGSSANDETKRKVEGLLASVVKLQRNVVSHEVDSVEVMNDSVSDQRSQQGVSSQVTLERLEASNVELKRKNSALKKEHANLLREKTLMRDNTQLETENAELNQENTELRREMD